MASRKPYLILAIFATLLSLTVVMLGAYTRLSDAGLGCPDWPGCYGHMLVPHNPSQIAQVQTAFPNSSIETAKAWKEMIHRYFAGFLGLTILVLFLWGLIRKLRGNVQQPLLIPALLVLLVIFQAILGMWTVTWKLLPLIVMGHLLGGMTITALLFALVLQCRGLQHYQDSSIRKFRLWAILGLLIVFFQIFLGGWTSANYAAIICPHFPYCQGSLFPAMNFHQAFNFFSPIGANYEGGNLDQIARMTIQMSHRYGAFITAIYIGLLSLVLIFSRRQYRLRNIGIIMLCILTLQFILGVLNVEWSLPLFIAVLHNAVAALLLLSQVLFVYRVFAKPRINHVS